MNQSMTNEQKRSEAPLDVEPLDVYKDIKKLIHTNSSFIVRGAKLSGKSESKKQLDPEFHGLYEVVDLPEISAEADYQNLRERIATRSTNAPLAIFLTHRHEEYFEERYRNDDPSKKRGALFKSFKKVQFVVSVQEAEKILMRSFQELGEARAGQIVKGGVGRRVLSMASYVQLRGRLRRRKYKTYLPGVLMSLAARIAAALREDSATGDEEVIKAKLRALETDLDTSEEQQKCLASILGLSVAGIASSPRLWGGAWDLAKEVAAVVIPSAASAMPFVGYAVGLGLSEWEHHGDRDPPLLELIEARGYWQEAHLSLEEKQVLSYKLERRNKQPPGTAYEKLSSTFGVEDAIKVLSESIARGLREESEARESLRRATEKLERTFTHDLREFRKSLDDVRANVTELKQHIGRIEKDIQDIRQAISSSQSSPTQITWDDLNSLIHARAPILSLDLQRKAQIALTALEKGDKVVILGEAGVGKSTLLYEICQTLLRRARRAGDDDLSLGAGALRGGETAKLGRVVKAGMVGLGPDDVYVADNLTPRTPGFEKIVNLPCPVVATARAHMWARDQPPGWVEIHLSRGDFPTGILRKILESALEVEHVVSTPKGIEIAVQKSEGLPVYLVELARWLKFTKRNLDEKTAEDAPPRVYDIFHDVLRSIKGREVVKLLYLLALTKRSRLHNIHLVELMDSREHDSSDQKELPNEFLEIVNNLPGPVYSLSHDTWKDVLLENWESQRGEREPAALIEFRNLRSLRDRVGPHLGAVREDDAFLQSVPQICGRAATDAAVAAQITLENRPELAERVLEEIHSKTEYADTVSMVSEVVTLQNAPAVKNYISAKSVANAGDPRGQFSWLWGLSKGREGAPRFQILVLEAAETTGKPLVQGDQEFRAEFAGVLNDLGGAFLQVGEVDNAIARCIQSEEMCRELAVLDQRYKPHHAKALLGLGIARREKGDVDEAINRLRDSEVLYRGLADHDQSFQPDLAAVLNGLGRALQRRNMDEAIKRLGESEAKYGELAKRDQNFQADHAKALLSLGIALRDRGVALQDRGGLGKGDVDNAIFCLKKSRDIYRSLAGQDQRFQQELASVLNSLGRVLRRKDLPEAISCFRESERIRRGLAGRDQRFELDLARVLNNLGFALAMNQDPNGAIGCFKESGEIYRRLADRDQSHFDYAWDLFGVGKGVVNLDLAEAIKDFRASEPIFRRFASRDKTFLRDHAEVLTRLGNALKTQGDQDQADNYLRESETILQGLSK